MRYFIIPYIFLELYTTMSVNSSIGFFLTFIWIIVSSLLGMRILKNSPQTISSNLQDMREGKIDIAKFKSVSILYFVSGILLIIPAIFSDFLGLLLFIYVSYLQLKAKITPQQTNYTNKGDDNVIDVEIID